MGESLLWVGRVVKTQGTQGQVRIFYTGEGTTTFSKGNVVYLEDDRGEKRCLTIDSSRSRGQLAILSFKEIKGVEEAEKWVGCSVWVPEKNLAPLPPDEFYWYQLLGLQVKTMEGTLLGKVEGILPTGSNDVFIVRKDGREFLIPATDEVVVQVDLPNQLLVIRALEGLLKEDDF